MYLSPRKSPCSSSPFVNNSNCILGIKWECDSWPPGGRHYIPPFFEGVGPLYEDDILATSRHGEGSPSRFLSEDAVLDLHQCRDGSIYTGIGARHQQCKGKSMESMGFRAYKASRPN